jgi:hypothetical protein
MKKTIGILLASGVALVALAIPALGSTAGQSVRVSEVDGRISLSTRPKAGTVRFVVRNKGGDEHNFMIRGGGKRWSTRVLDTGSTQTLTAKLKKSVRYSYWCGVSDHAQEGMRGSFVAR